MRSSDDADTCIAELEDPGVSDDLAALAADAPGEGKSLDSERGLATPSPDRRASNLGPSKTIMPNDS